VTDFFVTINDFSSSEGI